MKTYNFCPIANPLTYYLRLVMFIRLLFYFILIYFLLAFIARVIIPVLMATRNVRSKMKEMDDNMDNFQSSGHSSSAKDETFHNSKSKNSSVKGDYIDFEEIK